MIKTFTEHDLIRYLYRETTGKEEKAISDALLCDSELLALFNELKAMKRIVDESNLEPSEKSVANIMSHARVIQAKK